MSDVKYIPHSIYKHEQSAYFCSKQYCPAEKAGYWHIHNNLQEEQPEITKLKHAAKVQLAATTDNINNPIQYTAGDIECIDAIKSALTAEEFRGFLKGNVLKYTWRERLKGQRESLAKALWYINKLLEE